MRHLRSTNRRLLLRWSLLALGPMLALAGMVPIFGQQMHHNAFESNKTSWLKGSADVEFTETVHTMTDQVAHEGQRSEYIQINAKQQGSHVYYYYPTAKAPIAEELAISLWVKSNNSGIQLSARVVLPKEADPTSLSDRLTTIIRGESYRKVNAWQHLEVGRTVKLTKEQQQLMQAQLGRPVNIQDAYVDKLILNVYGGTGETDVWIDELDVGPVIQGPEANAPAQPKPGTSVPAAVPGVTSGKLVNFNGSYLQVDGKRFFFRGIRYSDTPVKALRDAGFNTLFINYPWDPAQLKQMVDLGFWLVPSVPVPSDDARLASAEILTNEIRGFPAFDSVLFWNLGNALSYEQSPEVARSAVQITAADRQHVLGADAWDGLGRYSTSVSLLSIHRWPLMSTMELTQYRDWLETRARLANPGTFLWTWIQTHTPDWYTQLLYDKSSSEGFTEPIGPQPEQVRLLTYLAVGTGFRGLGYWSDRFLADSHQGRDRLLTVALLNQELEFLEPLLNTAEGTSTWIDTSDANVKAAVLRTQKGILVLPVWLGSSAQFVPGQAAISKLTITVPQVPPSYTCWEVTPGEVRSVTESRGATGGIQITLREFGLTTALVFTSPDTGLVVKFQELCTARRQLAADYSKQLAEQELMKVAKVEEQLEQAGHMLPDGSALMKDATERLKKANEYWSNHQFTDCYRESQRVLRPLRIMMRAQWDLATRPLETPVASPWAVSFYTLPRHYQFMEQVKAAKPGDNLIVGGDFEMVPGRTQQDWFKQDSTLDDVDLRAERVSEVSMATTNSKTKQAGPRRKLTPKEGKQFLLLEIKPKAAPKDAPVPKVLERTFLCINSPTVKLPPGSLVRISGYMAVPDPIQASPDGALLYDSAGGDALAVRIIAQTEGWRHFTLYRRVPATGLINVTLALTGIGRVAFDDIKIEPMGKQ